MKKILDEYIKGLENCKPQDIIMGKSGSGAAWHNFCPKILNSVKDSKKRLN